MLAYHGTTHSFKRFGLKRANCESHVGSGVYLTSCPDDAQTNYSGIGRDLEGRIETLAETLTKDDGNMGSWNAQYKKAKQIAHKKLVGKGNYLLTCKIKEGAKLFKLGSNYIEMCVYNEDEDPEYTEVGQALLNIYTKYKICPPDSFCDGEMTSAQIYKSLVDGWNWGEKTNPGEIFKEFISDIGYDGVEYEDAHEFFPRMCYPGTSHYVVYKPSLVKICEKEEV